MHEHIGTRTSAQTRSHAQKFFNKLIKRGGKIEDKDLYDALVLNSRKKNTEMEINVDDDGSIDMSESASTPISKTKTIAKNYAARNSFNHIITNKNDAKMHPLSPSSIKRRISNSKL